MTLNKYGIKEKKNKVTTILTFLLEVMLQ